MRRSLSLTLVLCALAASPVAAADSPEVLVQRMKQWLEPSTTSTRQLAMTIRSGGEVSEWTAAQARGTQDGANFALTVLLSPADLRGTALLIKEKAGQPDREWLYLPYLRRVREVLPVDEFESFLNTEFTYADFGFVNPDRRVLQALGSDTIAGVEAVRIQETPTDQRTFTRLVTWLVPTTGRPLKREYYDVANRLWKVETVEDVADMGGVPTARRVRIVDVQAGFGSEYEVSHIAYGVTIPRDLFDPAQLSKAADSPLWK